MIESFRHQVGGHKQFKKMKGSHLIFKPYEHREYQFYTDIKQSVADAVDQGQDRESSVYMSLARFLPVCYGPIKVDASLLNNWNETVAGLAGSDGLSVTSPVSGRPVPAAAAGGSSERASGSASVSGEGPTCSNNAQCEAVASSSTAAIAATNSNSCCCHCRDVLPAASSSPVGGSGDSLRHLRNSVGGDDGGVVVHHNYLVLEDLVHGFRKPCVLDIKMGRTQRTPNASPEKQQRQLAKSLASTSHSLGFRLCGCQFYDRVNDILCYKDKYWGRAACKAEVVRSLSLWAGDGGGGRGVASSAASPSNDGDCVCDSGKAAASRLIAKVLEQLEELHTCVVSLRWYRLWGSSLLLVYDGGAAASQRRIESLAVRMIDFPNVEVVADASPDEEYIFALRNVMEVFKEAAQSFQLEEAGGGPGGAGAGGGGRGGSNS
eukprot:GHVU01085668.1.p1 GENE.GHVU01085668.1~~GHVU01085668.1.p1  ORF type:complete len:434 (+),score=74.16 GHVU01085668.1:495-1796(+)